MIEEFSIIPLQTNHMYGSYANCKKCRCAIYPGTMILHAVGYEYSDNGYYHEIYCMSCKNDAIDEEISTLRKYIKHYKDVKNVNKEKKENDLRRIEII